MPTPLAEHVRLLAVAAAARLDPAVVDYVAGGSGEEVSLGAAAAAWRRYRLAPRVLRDVAVVDPAVSVLGHDLPSPVGVAPIGYQRLLHDEGEAAVASGAGEHLTVTSARSDVPVETVGAARAGRPWWHQHYVTADRRVGDGHTDRAVAAGASAIVLTGDTPYVATKLRQGRLRTLPEGAEQAPATMADIGLLASRTGLPVLVKGVLRADDARAVVGAGAAGVVVSNHGGRQLDRAVAPADALPAVVAAVGHEVPVLVDGGVRSGHDVLVALALGAAAVLVGRPLAWALATGGADGVRDLLAAYRAETAHVMGLAGCTSRSEVTPDLLDI